MSPALPIVGVRLHPAGPVLWVACEDEDITAGALGLLRTPDGERSVRIVATPSQVLAPAAPLPGHVLLRPLGEAEALEVEPARGIRARLERLRGELEGIEAAVAPDGSRVVLLSDDAGGERGVAERLAEDLGVPAVARGRDGRLPEPRLPELLTKVEYRGETCTVRTVSVFRGEVTLSRPSGETRVAPLEELLREARG